MTFQMILLSKLHDSLSPIWCAHPRVFTDRFFFFAYIDEMPGWFMPAMEAALAPIRGEPRNMQGGLRGMKITLLKVKVHSFIYVNTMVIVS